MTIIICNSIIYWLTAIYFFKKKGLTLYSFLWFYYALFSFFSILLMKDDLYFRIAQVDSHTKISIAPYIILYLSFVVLSYALKHFSIKDVIIDEKLAKSKKLWSFFKFSNILAIIYFLLKALQVYWVSQVGFGIVHDMKDISDIIYPGVTGVFLRPINIICRINNVAIMPIVVFFTLSCYVRKYIKTRTMLKLVLPYSLGMALMGVVGGSRATMFFGIMHVMFFYILFVNYIPRYVNRGILVFAIFFSIFLVKVSVNITDERFGETASYAVENSILDYLGQAFPNVNYRIWQRDFTHPMGRRLFPIFWGESHDNDYFTDHYDVTPWIFHTSWGGLYEEFGLVLSIAIIMFMAYLMSKYIKRKVFKLQDVPVCLFIFYMCFTALFDFHFEFVDALSLIIIFATRYFFKNTKWI